MDRHGEGKTALHPDAKEVLQKLEVGRGTGAAKLSQLLEWEQARVFEVLEELLRAGTVKRARGRGGTYRRAGRNKADSAPPAKELQEQAADEVRREIELYPVIGRILETSWCREEGFSKSVVQLTAFSGRRATGGTWSRPDFTVVGLREFPLLLPSRQIEVCTFEVKTAPASPIVAVHEASAHHRRAHRSSVLLHIETASGANYDEDQIEAAEAEAERIGVGLIVAENLAKYGQWNPRVLPRRADPDPAELSEFLENALTEVSQTRLKEMIG